MAVKKAAKKPARKAPAKKRVARKAPVRKRTARKQTTKSGYILAATEGTKNIAFWTGYVFDDERARAKFYSSLDAVKKAATTAKKHINTHRYGLAAVPAKKS